MEQRNCLCFIFMKDISLKELLEAGCHFGHRKERWNPKATEFIYQVRDGVHVIDLVKTRNGLKKAAEYIKGLGQEGKIILFVASKRQAKGVVSQAAKKGEIPHLCSRWIGGFITNWDEVKKNIDKINTFRREKEDGSWNKFPKHEIVKLNKILRKLELVYGGVAQMEKLPDAVFIVDIRKEESCIKEAIRRKIPTIAIVDTNSNPALVDYPIPANDDAVGSIQFITNFLTDAYIEGKKIGEKKQEQQQAREAKKESERIKKTLEKEEKKKQRMETEEKKEELEKTKEIRKKKELSKKDTEEKPKKLLDKARGKRGRPKKISFS